MVFAGLFSALVKQEAAGAPRTAIPVTARGDTQVDTSTKKFGTGSCLIDGAGDYLEISTAYNSTFSFTGDFTIELWAYKRNTNSPQVLVSNWTYGFWLGYFGTNNFRVYVNSTSGYISASYTPSTNTWVHYAVVRSGTTVTLYIDGTSYGTSTKSGTVNMTKKTTFGSDQNVKFWNGNLEEIRISDTARYTANFTPATSAFTNDSNTLLLLHCNGTNGSTSFPDDNT